MAEITYEWNIYNKEEAIKGALVGIKKSNKNDISWTGRLRQTSISNIYTLSFQGYTLQVVGEGYVTDCSPSPPPGAEWIGYKLQMPFAIMGNEGAVGTTFTRDGNTSAGEPDTVEVDLSVMEPRDYFAVHAMSVMIGQTKHPETFDDAKCLYYAKAAYRWAQAMIIAAIDSRSEMNVEEEISVNLTIISEVEAKSTGEIKFYVEGHIGIWANLPDVDPQKINVYSFEQGVPVTFQNVKCVGNSADVSKYLGYALERDPNYKNPVVYAFDGSTHNSDMVVCSISGENDVFKNGGNYTITITAYNPPTPSSESE